MKKPAIVSVRLAVLLLALGVTVSVAQDAPKPATARSSPVPTTAAKAPWGRIVLVGASVSAGFTQTEMLGGPNTAQYHLNRYFDAALLAPHEPVLSLAGTLFFLNPDEAGRRQIEQALEAKPTLVVGLDFLFWFCYGAGTTDAERLQRLEGGLKLLEAVRCPLILGDIPDASGAAPDMLPPEQIPTAKAMLAANRRLQEWATARKQVVVVPLSKFMRTVTANQALTVRGHALAEGKSRDLLQADQLHPTPTGCAALALTALDTFLSKQPALSATDIRWDAGEVLRLALKPLPQAPIKASKLDPPTASPARQ